MKSSIWKVFLLLIGLGLPSVGLRAYGQSPPTGQSGSGVQSTPPACDNPPCSPLPSETGASGQDGRRVSGSAGRKGVPAPPDPGQIERMDQEMRYSGLFASLEADEKLAQQLEASGDSVNAASWRANFSRKSGLTLEEAEAVKKIAAQYRKDSDTLNAGCHADLLAARRAYGANGGPKFLEIPACQQLRNLFPRAMANLTTALGSRSFTRLDSYTLHMDDNLKPLTRTEPQQVATPQFAYGGIR